MNRFSFSALVLLGLFLGSFPVVAADLTSSSFILRDPVLGSGGETQSSATFQLFSGIDSISIGTSMAASFEGRFGFQYYPYVQSGTLLGVLDGSSVDLSWDASVADTGLNVSGYEIGIATVSGGPYTYTNIGNVTTYTYSGLDPAPYYFILKTLDGLGNAIALSNEEEVFVPQLLSFVLSDTTIGFGTIASSAARYATGDAAGSVSETEAHQLIASTNAPFGYVITVRGAAPTNGVSTITAIGASNTAPAIGTPQFGVRATASGGTGTVTAPYAASGFAYDASATLASQIAAQSAGGGDTTTYSLRYLANIAEVTTSGSYGATLTYVLTATF